MLRKLKWICFGLLLLLISILCLQNLTTIQLHFLFTKVELPQAIVILLVLLIGFAMGILASTLWKYRAWRARAQQEKLQQQKKQQETTRNE
jgi:uncharacterized integral membrane protein